MGATSAIRGSLSWSKRALAAIFSAITSIFLLVLVLGGVAAFGATPQVTGVTPDNGPANTQVQVNGTGFGSPQGSSALRFYGANGVAVNPPIVSWSDTQIVATVPGAAITGPLTVTVGGVSSNATVYFTVPPPQITSISPTSGPVGTQVTVTGAGFTAQPGTFTFLRFAGAIPTIVSWSDTQIVATVTTGTTSGPLLIRANNVSSNQDVVFTMPNPVVKTLLPTSGPVATQVQINGSGFGALQGSSVVTFYSKTASIVSWSDTQVTAIVPSPATSGAVQVTVGGVASNANVGFTIPLPHISSVAPSSGGVGTQVTIFGSGFQSVQGPNWTSGWTVVSWSDTQIVATAPAGYGPTPIYVVVNGTLSNQDVVFTLPAPVINSTSPTSGVVGTQVQVNGGGFGATQGSSTVSFGGINATVAGGAWTDTLITATVPSTATSGAVTVTVGGVPSQSTVNFTVPGPQITSVSPVSGAVGTAVTVTGTGFQATKGTNSFLSINGTTTPTNTWNNTAITANVPSGAKTGPVSVSVNGIVSNQNVLFTLPNPFLTGLSPASGPTGTALQISGSGFGTVSGAVAINGVNASITTWTATKITVTVPAVSGNATVVVTLSGVPSNTLFYSVQSFVVNSLSPQGGSVGTSVTINGFGFGTPQGTNTVKFNGLAPTVAPTWGATSIVAKVPTGATTGPIVVTVGGVASNSNLIFNVAGLVINTVTPALGSAGTSIQVAGAGFGTSQGASSITFNGVNGVVAPASWTNTVITVPVPDGASSGPIVVKVGAVSSNSLNFTVPAPIITSLSPTTGPAGTSVTIKGTSFGAPQGTSTISFNGVTPTVTSWTATQIVATAPAFAAGPVFVRVGSQYSNFNVSFTEPGPHVNSVSPASGVAGASIVIAGTTFGASQGSGGVYFTGPSGYGWVGATASPWSNTAITAVVPSTARRGPVMVSTGSASSNQDVLFSMPSPVISSISPTSGPVGATVQVAGKGFGATQGSGLLYFNGVQATSLTWVSDTQITATILSANASGPAMVTVSGINSNVNVTFTVPAPKITSLVPNNGVIGTEVAINGTGFGTTQGSNKVYFNSDPNSINFYYGTATVLSWSDTQILATVPSNAFSGPVYVGVGSGSNQDVLFTLPSPQITTMAPTNGPVGTQVQINGSGFGALQGGNTIAFSGISAGVITWADNQILAVVPSGAQTGPVVVTVGGIPSDGSSGGTGGNGRAMFTVPGPHIATIAPALAAAGHNVTITGTGFQQNQAQSTVGFNGYYTNGTIVSWSDTQIVTTVPFGAITGPVRVGVYPYPRTVSSNPSNFTVPLNIVNSVSPGSGPVGTSVTIAGSGFGLSQGSSMVKFSGQLAASITSWSDNQIIAVVPNTAVTGPVAVSVGGLESNITVVYTVPPPVVTSITPQGGPVGTQVTVVGTGFQSSQRNSTLTFQSGIAATVTSWSDTQIVATIPTGAVTGPAVVTVNSVASNINVLYTVPNPVISGLAPPSGPIGGTITLNGSGFGVTQGATVTFNTLAATVVSWSDTQAKVQVPAGSTSGPVTVTLYGITSSPLQFTVTPAAVVTSISPMAGRIGSSAIITGANFGLSQSNSTVDFNGAPATVNTWSDAQITVTVPQEATSGPVHVTVAGLAAVGPSFTLDATTLLTDSKGNVTVFTGSLVGWTWRVSQTQGSGCSSCTSRGNSTRTFDANGNVLAATDALGRVTNYTYDANDNVLSQSIQIDASHIATTSYTYNSFGQVLTMTDPLGNVTTNTYDTKGNLLTVTTPSPDGGTTPGSVTAFTYDAKGQLITIQDPLQHPTMLAYYPTGLIQTITDAQSNVTTYAYDARGNRTSVTDANQKQTAFAYDLMNRLTTITYPDNTTAVFGYDTRGRRITSQDQNVKITHYAYDDANHLTDVTDANNGVTHYDYDTESNLITLTDANLHATHFVYDAYGRVATTTFPSGLAESYVYDAVGNLTSKTDRKQQTIQYVYDALNRLTHKGYPDTTGVDYLYDLASRVYQVNDPTGGYTIAYDNMGRQIGTATQYAFVPGKTFTEVNTYDAASNRKGMQAPDGSTNAYAYDTLNRLQTLANSLTGSFGFSYDALSRRTQLTRPNGIATTYGYDNLSHLLSVLHKDSGGTTLDGANYTYDYSGNRLTKQNLLNNVTSNYTYDPLYELTQTTQSGSTTESYTYDAVGNRLNSVGVPLYSYNVSNQLTSSTLGSYAYDANGNTLTDASGKQYSWDFENRLTQVVNPGVGTTTFRYDPFGRRIQKSGPLGITNYLYDGSRLIEEIDTSGSVLAKYTQGWNIDEPLSELRSGTTSYYQQDGLGSVTALSNSTGGIANTYTYDAYGKLTASTGSLTNPFRYTGRELDAETGVYYDRARYYQPTVGRFISEDPVGYSAGINFYRYVRNNPVLFADPLGLCEVIARLRLWSSDEITIGSPRSPWELFSHQENADGILPINNLLCHWTREYNTTVKTTTTYLVITECPAGTGCPPPKYDLIFSTEKETTSRAGTTTKTFDYGTFTLTGFDSDFLEEQYCNQHAPPP